MAQTAAAGAGVPTGLDDDAAVAAAWLAARALPSLTLLIHDLRAWQDRAADLGIPRPVGHSQVDVEGRPASLLGGIIVDLAVARAGTVDNESRLELGWLSSPLFLLPHAVRRAGEAYGFEIIWREPDDTSFIGRASVHRQDVSLEAAGPSVSGLCRTGARYETMLLCRRTPLGAHSGAIASRPPGIRLDTDQLEAREQRSLAEGVEAEPAVWRQLRNYAVRTFVPASDVSRVRGAGHSSRDD